MHPVKFSFLNACGETQKEPIFQSGKNKDIDQLFSALYYYQVAESVPSKL